MFHCCFRSLLLIALLGLVSTALAQHKTDTAADSANAAKTVQAGVINGVAISLPKPEFSAAAREAKASGAVRVQVVIGEEGNVVSAVALSGHPLLTESAGAAAFRSKFKPTLLSGVPVRVTGIIVYNFAAEKELTESQKKSRVFRLGLIVVIAGARGGEESRNSLNQEVGYFFPGLVKEVEASDVVKNTPEDKKFSSLVEEVDRRLEGSLAQTWHYSLGKKIGKLINISRKYVEDGGKPVDMASVKTLLLDVREQAGAAPDDFSPEILKSLNYLCELIDDEELLSDQGMELVGPRLAQILAAIKQAF